MDGEWIYVFNLASALPPMRMPFRTGSDRRAGSPASSIGLLQLGSGARACQKFVVVQGDATNIATMRHELFTRREIDQGTQYIYLQMLFDRSSQLQA